MNKEINEKHELYSYYRFDSFVNQKIQESKDIKLDLDNYNEIKHFFKEGKLFSVDKQSHWLFCNTKPCVISEELKMGFDNIFVNDVIRVDDKYSVCGVSLSFVDVKNYRENILKDNDEKLSSVFKGVDKIVGLNCCLHEGDNWYSIIRLFINLENGKIVDVSGIKKSQIVINKIRDYILNMLLFLNEPRVSIYEVSSNNKRRIKMGKILIPSHLVTKLEKGFKEYININYESHSKLDYCYEVMGHWRILKHPRYRHNVGRKIWIKSFLRGSGLKPPQSWKLCSKEKAEA